MRESFSGFNAGEIDPRLWGRDDLTRYSLGASRLRNFRVHFGGGAFYRHGTQFVEYVQHPDKPLKLVPFRPTAKTNVKLGILFGHRYIRFLTETGYTLEPAVSVDSVSGNIVTAPGHGYKSGDWVYAAGHIGVLEVIALTPTAIRLKNLQGEILSWPSLPASLRRVYTLSNPFATSDLQRITYCQVEDRLKLAHLDGKYPPYVLRRVQGFQWSIELEDRTAGAVDQTGAEITVADSGSFINYVRVTDMGAGYTGDTVIQVTDTTGSGALMEPIITDGKITQVVILKGGTNYTNPTLTAVTGVSSSNNSAGSSFGGIRPPPIPGGGRG